VVAANLVRLFIAIELPEAVRRGLSSGARGTAQTSPAGNLSFTREANLHLTLKFLGEVPEPEVPRLRETLTRLPRVGPILLRTEGLEFFPLRGPIRVVAAKVEGDVGRLALVHREIESACESLGFAREARPYRPHVTLARSRRGLAVSRSSHSAWQAFKQEVPGPEFEATEFVLMESRLRPSGSEYIPLAHFPLKTD
jgi:2'-5' RNA ligase